MSTTVKPPAPKKPLNAVFLYKQEKYPEFKKMPGNEKKSLAQTTTEICAQYEKMSEKEKQKYLDMYKEAKTQYDKVEYSY